MRDIMKQVKEAHVSEYECVPDIVVTSPGRFHLIGEHSWFCKDKTLSMAVNLPVYVAISKRSDSSLKFYFAQLNERKKANISSLKFKREDRWANAVKAVVYGYSHSGFSVQGMNVTVYSEILPSSGFGITTAIKVATAFAIRKVFKLDCDDSQMIHAIELGNTAFLNTGNYKADIFAALYAKEKTLLLTDHATNTFEYIDYPFTDKKIMLTDARVPRISLWNESSIHEADSVLLLGELKERKKNVYGGWQYETNVTEINEVLSVVNKDTKNKLLCIMREHADLISARSALLKNDFSKFARSVNHSHESMKELFEVSCPEIDWIIKRVNELEPNLVELRNPVTCGRITGKGFGRCLYAFIRDKDKEAYNAKLAEYDRIFGFHPSTYEVKPARGVHAV